MAQEDKKDFYVMLHDNKNMPKDQMITDEKIIEKYGGNKMYFAPPIDYDNIMKTVPFGKITTINEIHNNCHSHDCAIICESSILCLKLN